MMPLLMQHCCISSGIMPKKIGHRLKNKFHRKFRDWSYVAGYCDVNSSFGVQIFSIDAVEGVVPTAQGR